MESSNDPFTSAQINNDPSVYLPLSPQRDTKPNFVQVSSKQAEWESLMNGETSNQFFQSSEEEDVAKITKKKCSLHVKSLFLSIFVWSSAALCFYTQNLFTISDVYTKLAYALFGLVLLIYYINCFRSGTRKFMSHQGNAKETGEVLKRILISPGMINIHTYSSHERDILVVKKDYAGYDTLVKETRAFTKHHQNLFKYKKCTDVTGIIAFEVKRPTRLHLQKAHQYANIETRIALNRQIGELKDSDKLEFYIEKFQSRLLVRPVGVSTPCCFGLAWYVIFSALGLSWFYRLYIQQLTDGIEVTIRKEFKA